MRQLFLFDRPSRFVAGTVGTPGDRTFYLQAVDGNRVVSVALEKQQVTILADRLEQLLDEIVERTGTALPATETDTEALSQPIDEEFRVAAMGLAWDGDAGLVVIEAQAPAEEPEIAEETLLEDVEDGPDALRVLIEPRRTGVHRAGAPAHLRRPAAVPAVRAAAGRERARLRAAERLPPRHHAQSVSSPEELTPALPIARDGTDGHSVEQIVALLSEGELTVEGRLVDASNATFYCRASRGGEAAACVYKPVAGERPLWDFPDGTLAEREVAAYEVSAATGWSIVPPTIYREGPAGPGMVQLWIDVDEGVSLSRLMRRRDIEQLRRIAVFDAVINNADRKGGHLLPVPDGHVWGVDHGVTFSVEDKLRTVLWQWAGQRLTDEAHAVLER